MTTRMQLHDTDPDGYRLVFPWPACRLGQPR